MANSAQSAPEEQGVTRVGATNSLPVGYVRGYSSKYRRCEETVALTRSAKVSNISSVEFLVISCL